MLFLPPFFNAVDGAIFAIGDSITVAGTDDVYGAGYPPLLNNTIAAATKGYWSEVTPRGGHGGFGVLEVDGVIAADLAATSATPTYVMILLGANDIAAEHWALFTETTWKAAYQDIIDKVHAKWADANIYLASSYREGAGYPEKLAILEGWMDDLIALNPSVCYKGIDTLPIFQGNEATLLVDDVHPNHAGFIAIASAWATLLGYA